MGGDGEPIDVDVSGGALHRTSTGTARAQLRAIFDHFDTDGNRLLNQTELRGLVQTIYLTQLALDESTGNTTLEAHEAAMLSRSTKWDVETRIIFERADTDDSGGIDFDEFVAAAQLMPVLSLGIALLRDAIDGSGRAIPELATTDNR